MDGRVLMAVDESSSVFKIIYAVCDSFPLGINMFVSHVCFVKSAGRDKFSLSFTSCCDSFLWYPCVCLFVFIFRIFF